MTLLSCDCSLPHALYLHHHFQAYSRLDWSQQSIAAFLFFLKKSFLCLVRFPSALLLHQRARMERLMKELRLEQQKLEQLKGDVNNMEYDALQRRFRRVNSTSLIPRVRPERVLVLHVSLCVLLH